jgi:hypothetical protein
MHKRLVFLTAALIGVAACGGDSSTGPSTPNTPNTPSYESVAGSYVGSMSGISQGITLNADFTLSIGQSSGSLSGNYSLAGTLTDGIDFVPIQGTGTLSGAIESGDNPSVNITVKSAVCPSHSAHFSGAYDSANERITITGPVEIFGNESCDVVLSYNGTLILNH